MTFNTKFGVGDEVWTLVKQRKVCQSCGSTIALSEEWAVFEGPRRVSYISVTASSHQNQDDEIYGPHYGLENDKLMLLFDWSGKERDAFATRTEAEAERDKRNRA